MGFGIKRSFSFALRPGLFLLWLVLGTATTLPAQLQITDSTSWRFLLQYALFSESKSNDDSIGQGAKTANQGWVGGNAGILVWHSGNSSTGPTLIRGPLSVMGNLNLTDGGSCGDPASQTTSPCAYFADKVRVYGSINAPGGVWFNDTVETNGAISIGGGGSSAKFNALTWTSGAITGLGTSQSRFVAPAYVPAANVAADNAAYSATHAGVTPFSAQPVSYTPRALQTRIIPRADFTAYTNSATKPNIAVLHNTNRTWRQSIYNSLPASYAAKQRADSILPPGIYGALTLDDGGNGLGMGTHIYLDSGVYFFTSIAMSNWSEIIMIQPQANRTMIFVKNAMSFGDASFFGPAMAHSSNGPIDGAYSSGWPYPTGKSQYYDPNYAGGTVLLYTDQATDFVTSNHSIIWASILAPNARAVINDPTHLFGQLMAQWYTTGNWLDGGGTSGAYIPFFPDLPQVNMATTSPSSITKLAQGVNEPFPMTFQIQHVNGVPVTVYFHTAPVTTTDPKAVQGVDYTAPALDSVVFSVGDTSVYYHNIQVLGSGSFDVTRYFNLVIDSVKNGNLGKNHSDSVYTFTILNNNPPPAMVFTGADTVTVLESAGTVSLPVAINFATSVETAVANVSVKTRTGAIAYSVPATVSVLANATTGKLVFTITHDFFDSPNDTLTVTLRVLNASTTTIGADSVRTLILKNTDPPVKLAASMQTAFTAPEPGGAIGATSTIKIPVVLAGVSGWDIPWSVKIAAGATATVNKDFSLGKTSGVIHKGSLSDTITLSIINDIYDEPDESFTLFFDGTMGATAHLDTTGKSAITVTIPNNDGPVVSNDTVQMPEYPPNGYEFKRLVTMDSLSPDTTIAYGWRLLGGADSAYFKLVNDSVKGWEIAVADSSVMNFVARPSQTFTVNLQTYGAYHSATGTLTIQLSYVQRAPIIDAKDTFSILENTVAGTPADTLFPGDNSGWNLRWSINGGSGASNFVIDSLSGIVTVAPNAVLDFEATKTQDLIVILRNQDGFSDTLDLVAKLINVLEYTHVSITDVSLSDGRDYPNPYNVYTNLDNFTLTWEFEGHDTTELLAYAQNGVDTVIRSYCNPTKDFCGADTVYVRRDTVPPVLTWTPIDTVDSIPKYTVVLPRQPGDTNIYVNDPSKIFGGTITYLDSLGNPKVIHFNAPTTLVEGVPVMVQYTYTDPYGNTVTDSLPVILDTKPPVVKILTPANNSKFSIYNVNVAWTVNGTVMDTLNRASLDAGKNTIIRNYMDLAGNIGADTVIVTLNVSKDAMTVDLVNPMVILDPNKLSQQAAQYPPRAKENYSLTVINQEASQEEELAWGTAGTVNFDSANNQRVYQGTTNSHMGPTLRIEAKFEQVGGTNGEGASRGGTLADLLERTRSEGIADSVTLCGEALPANVYDVPLWDNRLQVETEIYDKSGQFVDDYNLTQDSIGSKYLNDGGVAVFYFTLTPDAKDAQLKSSSGRALGTGAYIIRGLVRGISTYLYCAGDYHRGDKVTTNASILQIFGYRRP